MFGVCDGHGAQGNHVSNFLTKEFCTHLDAAGFEKNVDDVSFRQPVFLSVHLPCLHTDLFLPHYQQVNTDGCVCKVQQEQVIETSKRLLHSHYRLQLGFDYFRSAFFLCWV